MRAAPLLQGTPCHIKTLAQITRGPTHTQRHGRIERQHVMACIHASSVEQLREHLRSVVGACWRQSEWIDGVDAECGWVNNPLTNAIGTDFDHISWRADGDFIKAISAVQDDSVFHTEPLECLRHGMHEHGVPHPDHLPPRASRIGEWTNKIEERGEWQGAPCSHRMPGRGVMLDREAEAEANLLQHGGLREARTRQIETKRLEHFGTATTGSTSIAMLGGVHATRRGDQRSTSAGIEGLGRTTSPRGIKDRFGR